MHCFSDFAVCVNFRILQNNEKLHYNFVLQCILGFQKGGEYGVICRKFYHVCSSFHTNLRRKPAKNEHTLPWTERPQKSLAWIGMDQK